MISFHSRVKAAKDFSMSMPAVLDWMPPAVADTPRVDDPPPLHNAPDESWKDADVLFGDAGTEPAVEGGGLR